MLLVFRSFLLRKVWSWFSSPIGRRTSTPADSPANLPNPTHRFCYRAVTKINPGGTAFVFSTYLGGSGVTFPNGSLGNELIFGDQANAIAVDGAGNVYVAGSSYSADFRVTTGAYQTKLSAAQPASPLEFSKLGYNAFVTKLNPGGSNLVYSTYIGGSASDTANGIAIDPAGTAYIAGTTTSRDFPVNESAFTSPAA